VAKGPKDEAAQGATVDKDVIRELAKLLDETGLTEIEFERAGVRVRIARQVQTVIAAAPSSGAPAAVANAASTAAGDLGKHPGTVPSPMVGTAYLAPEPGARPYVEVGSQVRAG